MRKKGEFLRFFMRALCSLLGAGIPVAQSLKSLAQQQEETWKKKLINRMADHILRGLPLSTAMEKEPRFFSKFIVGLVYLGEQTGTLARNLEKAAQYLEENSRLKLKMASTLTYPAFLFAATTGGSVLLVKIFVPSFLPIFNEMHENLPFATRLLLLTLQLLNMPAFWLFFFAVSMLSFLAVRKNSHAFFLAIPFVGKILRKGMIAEVTSTLATAYSAGLPIGKALELASDIAESQSLRDFIQNSRLALARGEKLSSFFLEHREIIPPLVGHMMAVAEKTGKTDLLMTKCTRILEEEMAYLIQKFARLLEPGMLVVLGAAVTFIMIGVILPIYGMLHMVQ